MKIVKIILLAVFVILAAAALLVYSSIKRMDPVYLQYEKKVDVSLKRQLDFSPFEAAIEETGAERLEALNGLLFETTIEDTQRLILSGSLSCREVVIYYISRIREYDSYYNTVLQLNPAALEEAEKMDVYVSELKALSDAGGSFGDVRIRLGHLFGAAVLVKDNIAAAGMNTTTGAYALRELMTSRDSDVVRSLRAEGAVILGKSNLSEWSNFQSMPSASGFSVLGGQTRNAYGRFDVGGSSSGPASAAALNFASATIGTETAGSLIHPAGQNSVCALKPTLGLVSQDLIIPITEAQDTAGPMARTVEDAALVMTALTGRYFYADDDGSEVAGGRPPAGLDGRVVVLVAEEGERSLRLRLELEQAGAAVVEVSPESIAAGDIDMMSVMNYGMVHDVEAFLNNEAVRTDFRSLQDILDFNSEDEDRRIPFGAALHSDAVAAAIGSDEYEAVVERNRTEAETVLSALLEEYRATLLVSFGNELSGLYAPAGWPAITVPAGYCDTGEPYGVTFTAEWGRDDVLIRAGFDYQEATAHRKEPVL